MRHDVRAFSTSSVSPSQRLLQADSCFAISLGVGERVRVKAGREFQFFKEGDVGIVVALDTAADIRKVIFDGQSSLHSVATRHLEPRRSASLSQMYTHGVSSDCRKGPRPVTGLCQKSKRGDISWSPAPPRSCQATARCQRPRRGDISWSPSLPRAVQAATRPLKSNFVVQVLYGPPRSPSPKICTVPSCSTAVHRPVVPQSEPAQRPCAATIEESTKDMHGSAAKGAWSVASLPCGTKKRLEAKLSPAGRGTSSPSSFPAGMKKCVEGMSPSVETATCSPASPWAGTGACAEDASPSRGLDLCSTVSPASGKDIGVLYGDSSADSPTSPPLSPNGAKAWGGRCASPDGRPSTPTDKHCALAGAALARCDGAAQLAAKTGCVTARLSASRSPSDGPGSPRSPCSPGAAGKGATHAEAAESVDGSALLLESLGKERAALQALGEEVKRLTQRMEPEDRSANRPLELGQLHQAEVRICHENERLRCAIQELHAQLAEEKEENRRSLHDVERARAAAVSQGSRAEVSEVACAIDALASRQSASFQEMLALLSNNRARSEEYNGLCNKVQALVEACSHAQSAGGKRPDRGSPSPLPPAAVACKSGAESLGPSGRARQPAPVSSAAAPQELPYVADNSALRSSTAGLQYRNSPSVDDKSPERGKLVRWGDVVTGSECENGQWLKTGSLYLPLRLNGVPVLRLQKEVQGAAHPRQQPQQQPRPRSRSPLPEGAGGLACWRGCVGSAMLRSSRSPKPAAPAARRSSVERIVSLAQEMKKERVAKSSKAGQASAAICILSASGLHVDHSGSDVFCKCRVRGRNPDSFCTSLTRKDACPVWDFEHELCLSKGVEEKLEFEVCCWDLSPSRGRDRSLGKASLSLSAMPCGPNDSFEVDLPLSTFRRRAGTLKLKLRGAHAVAGQAGLIEKKCAGSVSQLTPHPKGNELPVETMPLMPPPEQTLGAAVAIQRAQDRP